MTETISEHNADPSNTVGFYETRRKPILVLRNIAIPFKQYSNEARVEETVIFRNIGIGVYNRASAVILIGLLFEVAVIFETVPLLSILL